MCQHSSPRGSDLSDLRASWHLPLDRSQIFTGARLFIDSVFPDCPMSISFPRSPEALARLCFPRALAAFSFLPPQHPAHFLPLQLLALLVFFLGGEGCECVYVFLLLLLFFFNPSEFVLPLLKKKPSVTQDFPPHSFYFYNFECELCGFQIPELEWLPPLSKERCFRALLCKHEKRTHKKEDNSRCNRGCGLVLAAAPERCLGAFSLQ